MILQYLIITTRPTVLLQVLYETNICDTLYFIYNFT